MAPKVKLFWAFRFFLKLSGLLAPWPSAPSIVVTGWKFIFVFYGMVHYMAIMLLAVVLDDRGFDAKLEAALFFLAGFPCSFRLLLIALKIDRVLALIDRVDGLLEEVETQYGSQTLARWQKPCNFVMYLYCCQISMVCLSLGSHAYYEYYWNGVLDVIPYETYVPFEKENHIHLVLLYEFVSLLSPTAGMIAGNLFFATLTVAFIGVIGKINEQCTQINPSNADQILRRVVRWHSEIISIMAETNSHLGLIFVIEYIFATAYICFSGFMLIKVGSEDASMSKNIVLCMACIMLPFFYCLCGHALKVQNDKLCDALFQNDWSSIGPTNKRNLLLPSIMANKGLMLHYRQLVNFDMTTYLKIVKQSYSFLTMLKLMENN